MRRTTCILSTALAATLCVCGVAFASTQASQASAFASSWAGTLTVQSSVTDTDISWYTEDPESNTFFIDDVADLRGLSALVNGTASNGAGAMPAVDFAGCVIYQTANLNMADTSGESPAAVSFTPIGTPEHPFAGSYCAAAELEEGASITNLSIVGATSNVGLFGYCSSTSAIRGINLKAGTVGGVAVETATALVRNVGSLAGYTAGTVASCTSNLSVTVHSTGTELSTAQEPYVVRYCGGLVGYSCGVDNSTTHALENSSFTGDFSVQIDSAVCEREGVDSTSSEALRVGDAFGGVVGRFGDPECYGTIYNCYNTGSVTTRTTGCGSADRFGTTTYANVFFVGGVCGYSNGSIEKCYNGEYNELNRTTSGTVFTGELIDKSAKAEPVNYANNRGADQTGGICGALRSVSEKTDRYNDGDPSLDIHITDCHNEGHVTGLVSAAGILGEGGTAVRISRCYNGTVSDPSDWTANQIAGMVVSTRWNKPISGGIVGKTYSGTVSYCANYAEVRNIQTGYYMAGIEGAIFQSDDHPEVLGELYACLNTGGIYTVNTDKSTEYREAGILGQNEGNCHDCVMLEGSTPYHVTGGTDWPIGANTWGIYSNLYVKSAAELQTSACAALLNAVNVQTQNWDTYWFIYRDSGGKASYPILNTWKELDQDQRIELTMDNIASIQQVKAAPYVGQGSVTTPELQITLKDGTVLAQNTDFSVTPDATAWEITGEETPYCASVTGIGLYRGTLENCAMYGIGKGNLADGNVTVGEETYTGRVQFPTSIKASAKGNTIDPSTYDVIIYANAVVKEGVEAGLSGSIKALDSLGYISFDSQGLAKEPLSNYMTYANGSISFEKLNVLEDAWWLWDRNQELVSDSTGAVYYTTGTGGQADGVACAGKNSCMYMETAAQPSGYLVRCEAKDGSDLLEGHAYGYYVINTVDLYNECTLEKAEYDGQTWYWDAGQSKFYTLDSLGNRDYTTPAATFTGETITPTPTMSYKGKQLAKGTDYNVVSGDPEPSEVSPGSVSVDNVNRNVTSYAGDNPVRAAITMTSASAKCFNNYVIAYFGIKPADFANCDISISSDTWAYTGEPVKPKVSVKLNGVELVEGLDYELSYSNNTEKGTASYTVTPLANLQGGSLEPRSGSFTIVEGIDISTLSIDSVADQQFNYGADINPTLTFRDAADTVQDLVKGKDYSVSYSTASVTKCQVTNPDGTQIDKTVDPCTITVTGIGLYKGTVTATCDIVPYDASANATNQLRVTTQNLYYGTWKPPTSSEKIGSSSPVVSVRAYPIVDWEAYAAGDFDSCYGDPITLTASSNYDYGALTSRAPAAYYSDEERTQLVSADGLSYKDASSTTVYPAKAEVGSIYINVLFRVSKDSNHCGNGASGVMQLADPIQYLSGTDLGKNTVWNLSGAASPVYSGTAQTPIVGSSSGGLALVEGTDYDIAYSNNVNAGTATFTATAREGSRYTGSYTGHFTIFPASLGEAKVEAIDDQTYTGSPVTPSVTVSLNGVALSAGEDYSVQYANNVAAGEASVTVVGEGNYTGTCSASFNIVGSSTVSFEKGADDTQGDLPENMVVLLGNAAAVPACSLTREGYDFAGWKSSVDGKVYMPGSSITVVQDTVLCAQWSERSAQTDISQADVAVTVPEEGLVYTGAGVSPDLVVTVDGATLTKGTDYTVSYSDNVHAGTAKATVLGIGSYTGTASATFTIAPRPIDDQGVTVSLVDGDSYVFSGAQVTPKARMTYGGVSYDSDAVDSMISVAYSNNDAIGTAKATVVAKGDFTGIVELAFRIVSGRSVVDVPEAPEGLVFDGAAKTGLKANAAYTLTTQDASLDQYGNVVATNAGTYHATATLKSGYEWPDGTTAAKVLEFTIGKAAIDMSSVRFGDATTHTITYTYAPQSLRGDVTYSAYVSGKLPKTDTDDDLVSVSYQCNGVTVNDAYTAQAAGTYTVTALFKSLDENYADPDPMTATLVVKQGTLKVYQSASAYTYNGKVQRPGISVYVNGKMIDALYKKTESTSSDGISIEFANASSKNAGTYKVSVSSDENYTGATEVSYTIKKASNSLSLKSSGKKVKRKALKKKAKKWSIKPAVATGTVSYSVNAKAKKAGVKVSKAGKVTLKKGLKKGTYLVTISAAGDSNHLPASKTYTIKVK